MFQMPLNLSSTKHSLSRVFVGIRALLMFSACLTVLSCILNVPESNAREASKCLAYAQTYYEQLYCEISSAGRSHKLPGFIDFQKNTEMTQALLLKPHAKALRIEIKLPKRSSIARVNVSNQDKLMRAKGASLAEQSVKSSLAECTYRSEAIQCGRKLFKQVTNQHNRSLEPNALGHSNVLRLPDINHSPQDEGFEYDLTKSYLLYLEKMLSIGLGAVTMTYTKFYYLYLDLLRRGVDFNQRFATMFEFLKKDKRTLGVSNQPALLHALGAKHCSRAKPDLLICEKNGRNYLFN